jgi:hypothetical protein
MTRRPKRGTSSQRTPRKRALSQGKEPDLFGRVVRGTLAFVLFVVLLLFAASVIIPRILGSGPEEDARLSAELDAGALTSQALLVQTGLVEARHAVSRGLHDQAAAEASGTGAAKATRSTDGAESRTSAPVGAKPIRVYLANGCGVDRLAATLRDRLVPLARIDVCGVSDADRTDYRETLIVDRCGDPAMAAEVCRIFQERWGVGRVLQQVRDAPATDVLVVLGQDLATRIARESR